MWERKHISIGADKRPGGTQVVVRGALSKLLKDNLIVTSRGWAAVCHTQDECNDMSSGVMCNRGVEESDTRGWYHSETQNFDIKLTRDSSPRCQCKIYTGCLFMPGRSYFRNLQQIILLSYFNGVIFVISELGSSFPLPCVTF